MTVYRGLEVQPHSFLISAFGGGAWSVSPPPQDFTPRKQQRFSLNRRLRVSSGRSGRFVSNDDSHPGPVNALPGRHTACCMMSQLPAPNWKVCVLKFQWSGQNDKDSSFPELPVTGMCRDSHLPYKVLLMELHAPVAICLRTWPKFPLNLLKKGKQVNFSLEQTIKAQKESRVTSVLFLWPRL